MAKVMCLTCRRLTPATRSGRCPTCRRIRRRQVDGDPRRRARKTVLYDVEHRRERAEWVPFVDTGRIVCWRPHCRRFIDERGPDGHVVFDLGHRPGSKSLPEHPGCNRGGH